MCEDGYNQVILLLQLVRTSCSSSVLAAALFMDELASLVRSATLHPKIEVCLCALSQ